MLWNGRITGISFSNSRIKERWKATLQTMRWRRRVPAVSTNKPGHSAWKSRLRNDMTKMTARILFLKATRWKLVKMTHVLTRFPKGITVFLFFSCQFFEGQFHLISFCLCLKAFSLSFSLAETSWHVFPCDIYTSAVCGTELFKAGWR